MDWGITVPSGWLGGSDSSIQTFVVSVFTITAAAVNLHLGRLCYLSPPNGVFVKIRKYQGHNFNLLKNKYISQTNIINICPSDTSSVRQSYKITVTLNGSK